MTRFEQHVERRLHAGDATPGLREIAGFHRGRSGGMIRRHDVDVAGEQFAPKRVLVRGVAKRWSALCDGPEALDVFGCKEKVMRASLDGNVNAPRTSFRGHRYRPA